MNTNPFSVKGNGKADLASTAPSAEELAWWKTRSPRHRWPYVLGVGSLWGLPAALGILLRHGAVRTVDGWVHASWIALVMGSIMGWATWKSAEPRLCANEIRARRLRGSLARTQGPPERQDRTVATPVKERA